ncbi:MAG: glycosyltransferase [Deltaproteobacteria bacterium]|jgi:tetratricopeptide (TPR) repeat protein|nr:glycosyltransferase [Deltaproteobacteria bacterium]
MLILCLGSEYFHFAFHKLGHSVMVPPHQDGLKIDNIYNSLQDRPDLIVFTDHLGVHAFPEGLSNIYGIPKVYYAVDTPINYWWQQHFAHLFDYTFSDQKQYAGLFNEQGVSSSWLPVAIDTKSYKPESAINQSKVYDFGFVGTLDPAVRPKRCRLVETLSNRYTLKTAGDRKEGWLSPAESSQLYRQSKLALNECLFPGVTTRMLEAMAAGTVLFTEKAGGDLGELFKPGEDFAWFEPEELLSAAEYWLGDDKRRRRAAKKSFDKVYANHDIVNRAETLISTMRTVHFGSASVDSQAWDHEGQAMFLTALRWPNEAGQARMVRAERLLSQANDASTISPMGLFTLGHINRMRHNLEKAAKFLTSAYEQGEPRGALGMAILKLSTGKCEESKLWLERFTKRDDVPTPQKDTLPLEAVKQIGGRLRELGQDVTPGFNRLPHDPAIWTAFEFYQSALRFKPDDLESLKSIAVILKKHGAMAEAMDMAQKGLEFHPDDETLGAIYAQAGRATYLSVN